MPGAIIPDDWDGSTFECLRVEWPSSELWRAILLGQVSKASYAGYWDAETGDPDNAAKAVADGYNLTIPAIYEVECDEPVLVPTFKAVKTVAQAIPAGSWTWITWQALEVDENDPGFNLSFGYHIPPLDRMGLWHYDAGLAINFTGDVYLHVWDGVSETILVQTGRTSQYVQLSYDYLWVDRTVSMALRVYSVLGGDILDPSIYTWWTGHYVGPVD